MGKIKNALQMTGEVLSRMAERNAEIDELARTLQSKTVGVEYDQARLIAAVLRDQAEITWK